MTGNPASIGVQEKAGALRWAAVIVSIAPAIGVFILVLADRALSSTGHDSDWIRVLLFGMSLSVTLSIPGFIAWRWHLLGGILLISLSGLTILAIVTDPDGGLFELNQDYLLLRVILPFSIVCFVGGVLHLIVWWTDRRSKGWTRVWK